MQGVAPVKPAVEVLIVLLKRSQAGSLAWPCRLRVLFTVAKVTVEKAADKQPPMLVVLTPAGRLCVLRLTIGPELSTLRRATCQALYSSEYCMMDP